MVRSARKMPPTPIVWRGPYRAGISKSRSVASRPPTWIVHDEFRALQRLSAVQVKRELQLGRGAAREVLGDPVHRLKPLGVGVVQRDFAVTQLGELDQIAQQGRR